MVRVQVMRPSFILVALALLSLFLALVGGVLSLLYYSPLAYPTLKSIGIYMQQSRATHTTFALAWIYLAAVAQVYNYLESTDQGLSRSERKRAIAQILLWVIAGIASLCSFAKGYFSGREYIEYPPVCSLLILTGWLLFAWNLIARVRSRFWQSPVYVYMWVVGALLFILTYSEGHLWLVLRLVDYSLTDIRIQWKSVGAMAGSFNLLVYGSGMYLGEILNGDRSYAQSRTGFALFGVGLLNSFTNYAHHTYNVPQNDLVKWISFAVSMTEIMILARVLYVLTKPDYRGGGAAERETATFLRHSQWWTLGNLALAIVISVPLVNSLFHGTHVVVAHAMGTTIGIDSFILFASCSWLLSQAQLGASSLEWRPIRAWWIRTLNLGLGAFLGSMCAMGYFNGLSRFFPVHAPNWLSSSLMTLFVVAGGACAIVLFMVVARWLTMALSLCAVAVRRARGVPCDDQYIISGSR